MWTGVAERENRHIPVDTQKNNKEKKRPNRIKIHIMSNILVLMVRLHITCLKLSPLSPHTLLAQKPISSLHLYLAYFPSSYTAITSRAIY